MVKLLPDTQENLVIRLDDLYTLKELGFPGADLAVRELDDNHLEHLIASDAEEWPNIKVTRTDLGYGITDGRHRKEAARSKGLTQLRADCKAYETENEVIEAAFQANLTHGLTASVENRSNYARWLHRIFPGMEQKEIARRALISQPSVSKALAVKKAKELKEPKEPTVEVDIDAKKEEFRKTCRSFARDALHFFDEMAELEELTDMEERELALEVNMVVKTEQEREKIAHVGRLVDGILMRKRMARKPRLPGEAEELPTSGEPPEEQE